MYSLGIDLGSSSVKAALVDESGQLAAQAKYPAEEMAIHAPQAGWAEQDPDYWWRCVVQVIGQVKRAAGVDAAAIGALGLAYQMHGLVTVGRDLRPVHPAIIWCDSRAVEIGRRAGKPDLLPKLLNLPGNFTASKLRWLRENRPDAYARVHRIMLPGDYIALRLTGQATTTIGGLSEGVFWDFRAGALSKDILEAYDIDPELIPEIAPTIGRQGTVTAAAAEQAGLAPGTPVTYRAGDQPNNALSLGVLHPGEVAATGGTSGVVYGVTDQLLYDEQSRVNAFAHVNHHTRAPRIGILMCINGTGIQYNWLRRQLYGAQIDYPELEAIAARMPIGADGVVCLPFGNGAERILGDRDIGAHLTGLNFNRHEKAHLIRAGLEGIAFAFAYGMEIMRSLGIPLQLMRVGNDNLFQSAVFAGAVATLTRCRIEVYETTGAVGAARAAAVGAGHREDLESIRQDLQLVRSFAPEADPAPYRRAYRVWEEMLGRWVWV